MTASGQPEEQWLLCPACGSKTRIKLRVGTVLQNFLVFCPKCKTETLINVEKFHTTVITEPDAKTQRVCQTQSR